MKRKGWKGLTLAIALIIGTAFSFNAAPLALAKDMTAQDFQDEAMPNITTISVSDAKALFDEGNALFLDVRTKKEYKSGHIPGAINVPRGLLEFKISKKIADKDTLVVVYCKSGGRSCLSAYTLVQMGYKNVKNMAGGWKAWVKAGYPVE